MKKRKTTTPPEHSVLRAMRELATEEKCVSWLLDFANQPDVEKLSAGEVDELHDFLFAFAAKGQSGFGTKEELPRSAAALFQLQEEARSGLRQAIRLDDPKAHGFVGWSVQLDGIERRVMRGKASYQGPLRAVFLAAVADVIAEDREKRLEMCIRPTCERFFWKRGRTKYCSKLCADADRQKRWRTKER
jgi:hypothetical protein